MARKNQFFFLTDLAARMFLRREVRSAGVLRKSWLSNSSAVALLDTSTIKQRSKKSCIRGENLSVEGVG